MRKKRIFSFALVFIFLLSQMAAVSAYALSGINGTPNIKMKVTDIKGDKPEYTGSNKILTNENDIKLNGDSYVTFKAEGTSTDLKNVKYKFFKQAVQPNETDFNSLTDWKQVDYEEFISNDVIENKPGYLTWRSYDVSHMSTLSNNNGKWSSRTNVYKNPHNQIQFQSTKTSTNVEEYIPRGEVTKSVFLTGMNIGANGGPYPRYKEASKFWGYIKPNQTGTYYFGISSDDGSYGYIIDDDGEQKEIVSRTSTIDNRYPNDGYFYPHGAFFSTKNTPVKLTAGKHYPIYLEYFNWGGGAKFEFFYNKDSIVNENNKTKVPQNWFYPSRTDTPGTVPESTFIIDYRAEIPKETGMYYIGIKSGSNKGIYGPFKISPKAPINLAKQVEKNQILLNTDFKVNYKIQPQPISAEGILPESYLKDKEIVLVMDTSGSMKENIKYNIENNGQSIFEEKYAPRNIQASLQKTRGNYFFQIDFDEPSAGEENNQTYLVFYSEKKIDEVENWLKNLGYNDLRQLHTNYNAYWDWYEKSFDFPLRKKANSNWGFKDIDGNYFKQNKSYNLYIATIKDSTQYNCKVVGLSKAGSKVGVEGTKKKIDVMKEVAKNFLEKLKTDKNNRVKVALVPYSDYARDNTFNNENFADLSDSTQYESLTDKIESLSADGGTNIGDGLRKAYYKFSNSSQNSRKYVILMTDGEPTFHSSTTEIVQERYKVWNFWHTNWHWEWKEVEKEGQQYFENGNFPNEYDYFGGGSSTTPDDKLYANKVAKDLILNGGKKIESFMIAFSNDADKSELKNIANSADGYYKEAVDGNVLDEVYQKLAAQIQSDLPIHGINFKEILPQGINIVGVSDGLEVNGQTVTGDIGSISYTLNKETNQFEAEPFKFTVTLNASEVGEYKLGRTGNDDSTSYIDYKDIDGTDGHKDFPGIDISVSENKSPEITASLIEHETNGEKYKLTLTIDEPAKIEIFNADKYSIWLSDKTEENADQYPKTFPIDINKSDLSRKYMIIKAEDKFKNMSEETVPLIILKPIRVQDSAQNDEDIKGILDFETEENSTITCIKVNGNIVAENKLTNIGEYTQLINLKEGNNEIEITVKNQFNNISTLKFNEEVTDNQPPSATIVTINSNNANEHTLAKVGDKITLTIKTDEDIKKPIVIIAGKVANVIGNGSDWIATYTMQSGDKEGIVEFTLDFEDIEGNKAERVTSSTNNSYVKFDKTPPIITISDTIMEDNKVNSEEQNNVIVSGETEVKAKVKITITDGNKIIERTVTADDNGEYSVSGLNVSGFEDGELTITVEATDEAGNTSKKVIKKIEKNTKKLVTNIVVTRKIFNNKTSVIEDRNFELVYTITPQTITPEDIIEVFGNKSVDNVLEVANVKFKETFPEADKFEVLGVEGLQNNLINKGVITGTLANINYSKQSDGSYKAQPFEIKVKLRVKQKGTYKLGLNNVSYLEYTDFKDNKVISPFTNMDLVVNPFKAQLQSTKNILADDDNFKRGETFKSKYTITPLELYLDDYFDNDQIALIQSQGENAIDVNGNKLLEDFVINNTQFQETVSNGLRITDDNKFTFNNGKVTGTIPNIIYTLNEAKDKLVANSISFEVQFKCISAGSYILGENNSSFVTYNDYDDEQGKKVFTMSSLEFKDINVEEVTNLLIQASLVSNSSNLSKYDLNVDVTEPGVNGSIIHLTELKIKNTADIEENIYDSNVTAVDGTKSFTHKIDESFLTGNNIKVVGRDKKGRTVTITIPIIKLITKEFVKDQNNIEIESQPDIWIDEFKANRTEYIIETIHPKTNPVSGRHIQKYVTLAKGSNMLEIQVRNSEGNISRRKFQINTEKNNVVKQGIFVKNNSAEGYIVGGEGAQGNINIIKTMVQHIGVKVKVNNNKSKFGIDVGTPNPDKNTKLSIYEINNGVLKKIPVFTAACKLNEISDKILECGFENGKTYIIEYTFAGNEKKGTKITSEVKVDGIKAAKLTMIIKELPKLD
ncbi:VWA domain-containing protein [Clostridium aestuarii]|uniref:VWA domain-containing protein n=1 Tax=Clostridium aestuarii TaxID=338193 RepID=A0ABT4D0G5_9CLOT|nr:VWA domain-containing protein [Clostridium aestuarii]MCY6484587.1 VWA domain-containing protein [Clostridium aestuarii]